MRTNTAEIVSPESTKYKFLLERNKKHMNYTAISFDDCKITYEELHEKINEYATALYKRGIKKGDIIGLAAVNTPESIYVIYALDRIGAITLGISPLNNKYQMKRDIEMVMPKMIISVDMLYSKFKRTVNDLDISPILYSPVQSMRSPLVKAVYKVKQVKSGNFKFGTNFNLESILKDGTSVNFDDAEYYREYISDIMYTGGSTGKHKGVELYGNGFNYLIDSLDDVFFLEPGQVQLGNVPINHMVFGKALTHYALCNNLEYALTLKMGPNDFTEEVIRTKAHGIMGGPIHFENLINHPQVKMGVFSNVIQAVSGGEDFKAKKKELAEEALRKGGSKAIIANAIGSTETESVTHVNLIDTREYHDLASYPYNIDYEKTPVTCGYPIPGMRHKIVDPATMQPVENGQSGLLLVSGPTVMKGYYNNPSETEKVFWTDRDGVRWFNTGDLMCSTGEEYKEVIFVGRKKRNFVCNVTNIYPEEIEELLLQINEIREAIVTKIPDYQKQFVPKYHISLNCECNVRVVQSRIEALIKRTLGEDALPQYIEFTQEPLPRTSNGKLDSTRLEKMDLQQLNRE